MPAPEPDWDTIMEQRAEMERDRGAEDTPEPCQCMTSFAAISPIHPGHCCFLPATQTCHPEAVAEWERGRDRRWVRETEGMYAP